MTAAALHRDTPRIAMLELACGHGFGSCVYLSPQTFSIVQFNIYVVDELLVQKLAREELVCGLVIVMFTGSLAL
jgi:hypothetical protein